jgi:hypothetical protein
MLQQGPVSAAMTLKNAGSNTINYHFQQQVSGTWSDIVTLGNDMNNTLIAAQVRTIMVTSDYPQVRLMANASGGSTLNFGLLRYTDRVSGGQLPLLSF